MTQPTSKVKVHAPGIFQGQTVKILQIKRKKGRAADYQLDTNWEGTPYPAWFGRDEFEIVRSQRNEGRHE